MEELTKLTQGQRKALEAIAANGASYTPCFNIKTSTRVINELVAMHLIFTKDKGSEILPTTCMVSNRGREVLESLRAAEGKALAERSAKPLSKSEMAALADLCKYGSLYQHVSGSWSDYRGNGGSHVSRTMNNLIARGYAVKVDDSQINVTDDGRKAAEVTNA